MKVLLNKPWRLGGPAFFCFCFELYRKDIKAQTLSSVILPVVDVPELSALMVFGILTSDSMNDVVNVFQKMRTGHGRETSVHTGPYKSSKYVFE